MKLKCVSSLLKVSLGGICLVVSMAASAEVAVIVHPGNANSLDGAAVSRIFLGKKKSFPDGSEAIPVDQAEGSPVRTTFVTTILKKTDQQIKAYWAQLLFTGKGTPPKEVSGGADVKKLVSANPSLIGYIDASEVDGSVKVVHQF